MHPRTVLPNWRCFFFVIPGCHCEGGIGVGCRSCGADGLIEFMVIGGLRLAGGALLFVLPASFVLAAIVNVVSKPKR